MRAEAGRLADDLAMEILQRHRIERSPRVDPWMLASALDVPVFDYDLPEDGRVIWTDGRPVVLLARDASLERRRFTLTHELGHVVLRADHLASPRRYATQAAFHSEEVLCDALAGAILMPRPMVKSAFARAPQDLGTIRSLARSAWVSLSAALVRLREVHRWQRTLLRWQFERGRWVYDEEAGLWPSEQGVIKPSEETTWALSDKRSKGVVSGQIDLPLRIGGRYQEVEAEVRFGRDHAVVLIDSPSRLLR